MKKVILSITSLLFVSSNVIICKTKKYITKKFFFAGKMQKRITDLSFIFNDNTTFLNPCSPKNPHKKEDKEDNDEEEKEEEEDKEEDDDDEEEEKEEDNERGKETQAKEERRRKKKIKKDKKEQ